MDRQKMAENLVKLRGRRTQVEVSNLIGISQSAYAMYESGKRVPSDEIKIKIANLYRKSVQSIFFSI